MITNSTVIWLCCNGCWSRDASCRRSIELTLMGSTARPGTRLDAEAVAEGDGVGVRVKVEEGEGVAVAVGVAVGSGAQGAVPKLGTSLTVTL